MKKKLTRILAALLIAMMLIPTLATFAVNAEGETGETGEAGETTEETIDISDIVNVYELNKLNAAPNTEKVAGAKDKEPTDEEGMLASKPFTVTADGDRYIYVGPCADPEKFGLNDLIMYWYKKDGSYYGAKSIYELKGDVADGGNVVDRFEDGSVILRIKVNQKSYQKFAAIKVPTTYADFMLISVERAFTVEEYYAYADAQGWELDGTALRPLEPVVEDEAPEDYEGLWNFFPLAEDFVAPSTQKEATNRYKKSEYIHVAENDVIRIGAVSTKENQPILYTYSDEMIPGENTDGPVVYEYKELRKHKKGDNGMAFVENIGYDYAIYAYTVPEGVSYIKVAAPEALYGNGDILVTKNQPFNAKTLRTALEIPELSAQAKAHDFNGKTALFVGDSILMGEYDTPSSFSSPLTSFARRLALSTGLIPTVYSANGATIGKVTSKSNVKQAYDLMKISLSSKKEYDMVIFQGGINDARQNLAVGEILPVDTAPEVLEESERLETFAGGLQWMFYNALTKWTEAEFYYIADYKVASDVVNGKDMGAYYAQAKALCEIYGIHYIDLYDNTELYESFDYTNAELFADDKFTPLASTYDLLFPTVLSLFDESLNEELTNPFADIDDIAPPPPEPEGPSVGLIIAIVAAGVVVLAGGGFALYWFVIRKKKVAKPANIEAEAPASEPEATTTEESTSDEVKKDE